MDESNFNESQKLMEKFNFDSPIQVTLVIEEDNSPNTFISYSQKASQTSRIPTTDVGNKLNQSTAKERQITRYKRTNNKNLPTKNGFKDLNTTKNNSSSLDKNALRGKGEVKSSDFPWHLLNPVIENLIHISKFHYHNILSVNKQRPDYETLKSEYLMFKHHFFNLSYSTTLALLLPYEKDDYFLSSFVERIIQIADMYSWKEIAYERIYILIRDLLSWTNSKKNYINKRFGLSSSTAEAFSPSITSRLRKRTVNPNENIQRLNISSTVNYSNKSQKNNLQQPTNPSKFQTFQRTQGNNLYPNTASTISAINNDRQYNTEPTALGIVNYQNTRQTKVLNYVSQENCNYGTPPSKRIKPNNSHNIEEYNTDIIQTSKDPLRSSISRDSGFASPPYINSPDNELNPILNPEEVIPIISHVTSTNPNAVNIQSGNCVVCQSVTNKMCIGCYQKYYCSPYCQELDWSLHQMVCKNK
ncbi:uncharacterized protein LOC116770380 [Danaus plexippus]|uniref:uncharacterized protein LOC116770380 n=1 Tax=Danaus plexippus TaxID=13037 RepID=UPI002AB21213|nr:uncharacterized protein LOC116770380 [Danaus plexippus]XP_061383797.1 uncharacterized protein LOC116770380 [Danaus plexippus]